MDLNTDVKISPSEFLRDASFEVAKRRNELLGAPGWKNTPIASQLAWQEAQILLLKSILDELVKARLGIRT